MIAVRSGRDQPDAASHLAQPQKSSKTFCLRSSRPASCQALPYSPPPRRFATASRPPRSSHAARSAENTGVSATSNPPYAYSSAGTSPLAARSRRRVTNMGTGVPSAEGAYTCSVMNAPGSIRALDGRVSFV